MPILRLLGGGAKFSAYLRRGELKICAIRVGGNQENWRIRVSNLPTPQVVINEQSISIEAGVITTSWYLHLPIHVLENFMKSDIFRVWEKLVICNCLNLYHFIPCRY